MRRWNNLHVLFQFKTDSWSRGNISKTFFLKNIHNRPLFSSWLVCSSIKDWKQDDKMCIEFVGRPLYGARERTAQGGGEKFTYFSLKGRYHLGYWSQYERIYKMKLKKVSCEDVDWIRMSPMKAGSWTPETFAQCMGLLRDATFGEGFTFEIISNRFSYYRLKLKYFYTLQIHKPI
jgi:hypothetical protein